jgi:subtilisin family serine protease
MAAIVIAVAAFYLLCLLAWREKPASRHLQSSRMLDGPSATAVLQPVPTAPVTATAAPSLAASARSKMVPPSNQPRDVIPGEYILRFFNAADLEQFIRLLQAHGGCVLDRGLLGDTVRIRLNDVRMLDPLMREGPTPVEFAYNSYVRAPPVEFRDPRSPEGGYVAFGRRAMEWLGAPEDRSNWGAGVLVAVLDSGVIENPALWANGVKRVTLLEGVGTAEHGTEVAAIIAGMGADVQGVSPQARLLSIQVLNTEGVGDVFTLARGIVTAVDQGAKVINLSLGAFESGFILRDAVDYARRRGVAVVAASGNEAVDGLLYPAAYDDVIAVGAVDAAGRQTYFSNRGAALDIAAPGVGVTTAASLGGEMFSGTSAATPFVSGALAYLFSRNPGLSLAEATQILRQCSDDGGAPGWDPEYGYGVLNLRRLIQSNTLGIYDVGVGDVTITRADGAADPLVRVPVQNRGTESLSHVSLAVNMDGGRRQIHFYDLKPGETRWESIPFSRERLNQLGVVTIEYEASISGRSDVYLNDNMRRTVFSLKPVSAEVQN